MQIALRVYVVLVNTKCAAACKRSIFANILEIKVYRLRGFLCGP